MKSAVVGKVDLLEDKWKVLPAYLKVRGIVKQHIDSYNYLVDEQLLKLIKANEYVRCQSDPHFYLKFLDIRVGTPVVQEELVLSDVTPMECRLRNITYAAPILVDVEYTRGRSIIQRSNISIGDLPVMLKSNKCVLSKCETDKDFAKLNECPLDPGGYFITYGGEKVIMAQEQMSNNKVLMDTDKDGNIIAHCNSSTHITKSKTSMLFKKRILYLVHNSFSVDIPVIVALKAMGIEGDQEILQLVGLEYIELLTYSIEKCKELGIYTQKQALEFVGSKVKMTPTLIKRRVPKEEIAFETLSTLVYSHVPNEGGDFHLKSIFLCLVIRRVLQVFMDPRKVDDKDYYGNKRLQLAGDLLSILLEDLIKQLCSRLSREADTALSKAKTRAQFDILKCIKGDIISRGVAMAISSGNWRIKRFRIDRAGVSQSVTRLSYISSLGTMTKVTSQFEKTRKVAGPRALQPSQFGVICPSDTPEGESCGLLKNLALVTHVTTDSLEAPIVRTLFSLGIENIQLLSSAEACNPTCSFVFLNGSLIGICVDPLDLVLNFRKLRRSGAIDPFTSVYYEQDKKSVFVNSDAGRVCRPLIIVENGKAKLSSVDIDHLSKGFLDFNDLLLRGVVEYVDVNEENDSLIALQVEDIIEVTTHLEIDPLTLLGICAGLIPYPHHNQSPRNTYQSVMGKQAMGAISYNQFRRFETIMYLLCYPQKPLVKSKTIEFIGFEKLPAGHNAMVAVMSYSGYDIEDAMILNRSSIDRGFGRCQVMKKYQTNLTKHANGSCDRIVVPHEFTKNYQGLDLDGIVNVGAIVNKKDILVNKEIPANTKDIQKGGHEEFIPQTLKFNGPSVSLIDQVLLTSNSKDHFLLKCNVRSTRRPERGDKFSSRHGQKGVCGLIAFQEDMPFNDQGICPDIIMNPHGFPSRMTVGKMIELIAGKAGVLEGEFKYGTAFGGDAVQDVGKILVKHGFSFTGKDTLTSGITGEQLSAYIFMGPIYYQKLKHMVMDKIHARSTGPRSNLTRQPTEGRSNDGGLRLGEMERDCLIGYGASLLLQERLMISSDKFAVHICEECGLIGYETKDGNLWCTYCKNNDNMTKLSIPYATKLLFQEMMSMGIMPRLRLRPL